MRFRVMPYTTEARYYVVQYKRGFFSFWNTLIEPWMMTDSLDLWDWSHPMLFGSFDMAVAYAETLEAAKVDAYIAEKSLEWNRRKAKTKAEQAARRKTKYL